MTSEGLGEMFEGDSADTCTGKFLLMSMGGQAEGIMCEDPHRRERNLVLFFLCYYFYGIFVVCLLSPTKNLGLG